MHLSLPKRAVADRVSLTIPLQPGEKRNVAELDGAGCIKHIFVVCGGHPKRNPTPMANRKMVLRIYFDGAETPHVEAPVGDFFGVMHGQDYYPIDNHYLSVKAWNGMNSYFHMPFADGARVEVEVADEPHRIYIQVDWERYPDQEMTETRRFCARWRREMPTQRYGEDFLMLDADGPGELVGFVYGVRLLDDADRWSHGGSDNIYIDGDGDYPGYLRGIGGEDVFGSGYGGALHPPETHHFAALPYYVHEDVGQALVAHRLVGYRFYDNDRVQFDRSLQIRFGCMANDICATVYWYSDAPVRPFFKMPDFPQLLPGVELPRGTYDLPIPTTGSWWLNGPYGNEGNRAMTTTLPAETEFQSTARYDGMHEEGSRWLLPHSIELGRHEAHWVRRDAQHNFVDFNHVFRAFARGAGITHPGVALARCILRAPSAMTAKFRISWDNQLTLRVNGEARDLGNNYAFRTKTFDVPLVAGENEVILKLSNEPGSNHGGWLFAFQATAPNGELLIPASE